MSQNFLTNSSCRNDNLTQIRNKFDAILSDFIQNIHNAKNQVTNIKSKANSGELRNFTIWLNSFDKFLLELDEEITKFNEKIDSYNKNNYSQLNEWSHEFVAILFKKELPQDITADFENQYQQCQQLNDLLKDSISQANNNLQKILENSISENNLSENQLNQYAGTNANQPLVELLRKFEKLLLETEQDANSYIPDSKSKRNSQQEKIPNYEEIIEWLKTLLDKFNEAKQQFSNSKHIQLCVPPENIEKIYTNVIQQTDKLKIDIETFSTNSYLKGFPESQNTNYRISRYSKFTEYIKSFLSHISVSKRDLLDKIDLLVNENHDMDIDNKDENNHSTEPEYDQPSNRINASGKMISNANHKSTNYKNNFKPNASYKKYSWNRKRHDQPNYNQQIEELEKLKNENKELLEKVGDLEAQLKSGNHRIKKLMDEHKSLRVETAKYQSALGKATNFRINDHNPNSVSQLVEDIKDLKHQLDNFCSLKKVDIDYTALKELLGKYGCLSSGNKPSKNLVKGILQRHVIEMVINNVNKYLKIDNEHEKSLETSLVNKEDSLETSLDNKEDSLETSLVNKEDSLEKSLDNKEDSLETSLVNKEDSLEKSLDNKEDSLETIMTLTTIKLLKCMESFSKQRTGTDEVTQAAPTKLRQLVYTILGIRGFSGTPNEGEHPFIIKLRDLIMENLNKYRTIKGTQKIDEIKSMATELIHQIISIFCFRRNIQEPVVEYKWYKYSDKVDLEFMECPLDEVDEIMVDICSFPLIGTNLEHEDKYKVISQASVVITDYIKL